MKGGGVSGEEYMRLENEGKRDDGYVEGEGEGRYVRTKREGKERKICTLHVQAINRTVSLQIVYTHTYLVSWSEAFSSMATSVGGGPFSLTEYTACDPSRMELGATRFWSRKLWKIRTSLCSGGGKEGGG